MGLLYSYFFYYKDLEQPLLPTAQQPLGSVLYNTIPYSLLSPTQSRELESMTSKVKNLLGIV